MLAGQVPPAELARMSAADMANKARGGGDGRGLLRGLRAAATPSPRHPPQTPPTPLPTSPGPQLHLPKHHPSQTAAPHMAARDLRA